MPDRKVLFGVSLGAWNGTGTDQAAAALALAAQADEQGLDLFTTADHPYFADRLDAYSLVAFILGRTSRISGVVTVTNVPSRPAPMLARAVTSLSVLSGRRIVLGVGAGFLWDEIVRLGVPRLEPGAAVQGMAEAITLVHALSGGGDPVTFDGTVYHVSGLTPAAEAAPPIWTGSVGPKSLAVTQARRRLGAKPRLGLAEPAVPGFAPGHRRGRGRGGPRPVGRRDHLQLRRPHHSGAAAAVQGRRRTLGRRFGRPVGRRADRGGAGAPGRRLRFPQHR